MWQWDVMKPKTLRRKQQKKAKRLRYRVCEQCGHYYMTCHLSIDNIPVQTCRNCDFTIKRPWLGGGIGRRILGINITGKGVMPV